MWVLIALTVDGRAASRLGREVAWKAAVFMAKAAMWSRCGCVIRYVETCSRTMCRAFARAVSYGRERLANGPEVSVRPVGSGDVLREEHEDSEAAPSPAEEGLVAGLLWVPFELGMCVEGCGSETRGKSAWRSRVIDARCEPASTASTDCLDQLVARARTRKPVTLSSAGPPPEA